MEHAIATFAGGCFWCLESAFHRLDGVEAALSGYTGGQLENPRYEQVCSGGTGHAEAVQVRFDPARVSYAELLEVFFALHDPTTLNRQGHDVGTQYRSAVFFHDAEQAAQARAAIARLEQARVFERPVVTEVAAAAVFWPAEDYHQRYFDRNPQQPYCRAVVGPKLAQFTARFATRLRAGADRHGGVTGATGGG